MSVEQAEGEAERFERIYRSTYPALATYVRRRIQPTEVDDVLADLYLMVWRKLDQVPESPLPWLYRSAWLQISSSHRAAGRRPLVADPATWDGVMVLPDHGDLAADMVSVAAAMSRLSAADAEILRLRYWEDLDGQALSAALGCSAVTARVRLHRAHTRLARVLGRLDEPLAFPRSTTDNPVHPDWSRR